MTTGRPITDQQINALAAFIAAGHPSWDAPGVVAALRAERESGDAWQLAHRILNRASDPANKTPRLQPFDSPRSMERCADHPTAGTHTDGRCGGCIADAAGVEPSGGEPGARREREHPLREAFERVRAEAKWAA